jgi:cystathionine beta-lyase/cystathionine gamma-synthase
MNKENNALPYIERMIENMPEDWLKLTTHRLDVYDEGRAKHAFLEELEALFVQDRTDKASLEALPTAYDYIRLGHPLSCVLEWTLAKSQDLSHDRVITFSSRSMPLLAILRKNHFLQKNTRIVHDGQLPACFDFERLQTIYGYHFESMNRAEWESNKSFDGSTVQIIESDQLKAVQLPEGIDFLLQIHPQLGSILWIGEDQDSAYISEVQHVRRRESISMTPVNCKKALEELLRGSSKFISAEAQKKHHSEVLDQVQSITQTPNGALLGSSGLSVQYAIMMGLIDNAVNHYPNKAIKIIVPPNCYGGTNDQARRVAACLPQVEILDLLVDRENDMVESVESVLAQVAKEDAVPLIIAEIPTNPRVEVPDMAALKEALSKERHTADGAVAIDPVFILDQTFCPNIPFLSKDGWLGQVRAISYVSGSKFPSGGKCTAGYCVANETASDLLKFIDQHLQLCDNQATPEQVEILAQQLPSMLDRIQSAYLKTREFVNFIGEVLPSAKINFVSEALAEEGFTPSVFSLDLPTKGESDEEREQYKRALNLRLITMMITEIPNESKYCVSYGQLKGCYWTIPATSTQGTTKEGDKDYIARVSLAPEVDLEKHKAVFSAFVEGL